MTEYADIHDLLDSLAMDGAEDFTLKSGKIVRLRGLTRAEHLWIGKGTEDASEIEARMLSKAMLQPALTLDEVKQWQASASSASVSEISDRVRALSGFGEGADKSDPGAAREQ